MPWAHAAGPISDQRQRDFVSDVRQKKGWGHQEPAHLEVIWETRMLS